MSNDTADESDHEHDHNDHHHAHDISTLRVAILTVSSSRSAHDDPAGEAIDEILEAADHRVVARDLVADDRDEIRSLVREYTDDSVDAVITTGGTGVTPDDVTVEAVSSLFSKELPGFGELFRRLSYEEIGTRVVGTRATAGIVDGVPVFCLPGSENAARLGSERLVVPELPHLAGLAQREPNEQE